LIVAFSIQPRELELAGTADELRSLGGAIESGAGSFALQTNADVSPYDIALRHLKIETNSREGVAISVDQENNQIIISGPIERLMILGQNVSNAASSGDHLHIEYFPDHFYLDRDSVPLVIVPARETP
jgi:hypothetical protein